MAEDSKVRLPVSTGKNVSRVPFRQETETDNLSIGFIFSLFFSPGSQPLNRATYI